jgi:6-pyruvoyltetrahydropterin/6-carboxytetrahydropterin synthase
MSEFKVTATRSFSFHSAHKLPNYKGDCANLHGHSYKGEVTVSAPSLKDGMVLDFNILDAKIEGVMKKYDHRYLNDIISNPTAEIIAMELFEDLDNAMSVTISASVEEVVLYETENSKVTVRRK